MSRATGAGGGGAAGQGLSAGRRAALVDGPRDVPVGEYELSVVVSGPGVARPCQSLPAPDGRAAPQPAKH